MFDFEAWRTAVETRDVETWLAFFADGAEWVEYRPGNPPKSPRVLRGREEIRAWLEAIQPTTAELRVTHVLVGERYVNYLDDDEAERGPDPVRAAYGPNYDRLVEIKTKYDPENVFHLNFNIPPRGA